MTEDYHYDTPDISDNGSEKIHYDNLDFQLFCRKNFNPANSCFPGMTLHWHNDLEFIYVFEGETSYQLNGRRVLMKAGEGIFVNSNQLHLIISENSDCGLYCIIFHPTVLCSSKYIEEKFVAPIVANESIPCIMLSEKVSWQNDILQFQKKLYELSETENSETEMMQTLFALWTTLYKNLDLSENKERYDGSLNVVRQMLRFVHDNYKQKITLNDLCRAGGVGKTCCAELFRKYVSCSAIEYVINYRIKKSVELLLKTDMSVTEIALETGFSGGSFYAETFRKKLGVTPLEFRRREQK